MRLCLIYEKVFTEEIRIRCNAQGAIRHCGLLAANLVDKRRCNVAAELRPLEQFFARMSGSVSALGAYNE